MESPDTVAILNCPKCGTSFIGGSVKQAQVVELKPENKKPVGANAKEPKKDPPKVVAGKVAGDLKGLETRIDEARTSKVVADWEIGHHLSEIHRRDLWQASGDYTSFVDYAEKRFEIGKDTAWAYLRIAETFSREQATELSITQLWHLARVPDEKDRARLLNDVKAGKYSTTRQLADAVKTKRAEAGLKTERNGLQGTVLVHSREVVGVIAEGELKKTRNGGRMFSFAIGDAKLQVVVSPEGDTVQVKLLPED
jgi:hypothetical protein